MSDEEEANNTNRKTRALVAALASSRPDTWLEKKRTEFVSELHEHVRQDSSARRVLATWNGVFVRS
jgi:hypothetical protein